MYPTDETANLNAANCAIMRGDYKEAASYLAKAGDTAQAIYARGVLAAKTGEYARAKDLFEQASAKGIDVTEALKILARATEPEVVVF